MIVRCLECAMFHSAFMLLGVCPNMVPLLALVNVGLDLRDTAWMQCLVVIRMLSETNWKILSFLHIVRSPTSVAEEPNEMRLYKEQVNARERETYQCRRQRHGIYKAAAELWSQGVPMQKALSIIRAAVRHSM